jgi:hypothetical protein
VIQQALLQNQESLPTERYPFNALMHFPLADCINIGQMFEVELILKVSPFMHTYTDYSTIS